MQNLVLQRVHDKLTVGVPREMFTYKTFRELPCDWCFGDSDVNK